MKFKPFTAKQKKVLTWWAEDGNGLSEYDAIICDGAVRSGKTLCMSISFVLWATASYKNNNFAICGKTLTSLKRNVVTPLCSALADLGFVVEQKLSAGYVDISLLGKSNRFYLFGGKDEGSAALIQGITLAGVMLDEVALMPRSFVEQALARCSVSGSKLWFNCNPEHPYHWFYLEWIKKAQEKNALYLHFTMRDNPSLSKAILRRYEQLYSGVFRERFIEGKWVAATGLVYTMFDAQRNVHMGAHPSCEQYYISCDYGTVNPSSFGLWGKSGDTWYRLDEYYYDSRKAMALRTDEEHYAQLEKLAQGKTIEAVVVDPSAASFMECIRRHKLFRVIPAKNEVLSGIRRVCDCIRSGEIMICTQCKDSIREFSLYCWEDKAGSDCPKKENDHAMDDIRYFVSTILNKDEDSFFVLSTERR